MELPLISRDPASAMAEFEQILASNSGEDPFDSAIKLLAAKLYDEIESRSGQESQFAIHKTPETTHRVVQSLYRKALQRWPMLNGTGPDLDITPQHLVRSLRPLVGWQLGGSDLSYLDATLERLVAKDAKGALGQYFTPRDVIRLCIEVLNPGPKDKVIDPACGSGGFLFEATNYSVQMVGGAPSCLGIDFGARAIKVAALLAAATPKAKITVSKANSIDGRAYAQKRIPEWQQFLSRDVGANSTRAVAWGDWNKLGCTVLATNPPFAGDIDEPDILDAYESQRLGTGRNTVGREHLFLERSVHLLKPNGRLAIVLPQGLLANPSASYLRAWLLRNCRVLGVIGLHPHAFMPYTSVKTALLFAVKRTEGEPTRIDHPIFFATSRNCGKDSRGRVSGSADYPAIAAAFKRFLVSEELPWASEIASGSAVSAFETVLESEVLKADRLDAEHYDADARALLRQLNSRPVTRISALVDAKPERFKKTLFKKIQYIDISSVDSKTGLITPSVIDANEAPSRASYIVQPGDVLVSTVRPDRNVIALVTGKDVSLPIVASNGFCVLRPRSVAAEVLFAYCKTESFKRMLTRHATASMYPTVTDRDVLSIPFLEPRAHVAERSATLVRSALEMLEKAQTQLNEAVTLMTGYGQEDPTSAQNLRQSTGSYRIRKRAKR